jgi:hypothetical protein
MEKVVDGVKEMIGKKKMKKKTCHLCVSVCAISTQTVLG